MKDKKETELALAKPQSEHKVVVPVVHESIKPLTAQDVVNQVNLIKEIQKKVMVKDVHYGIIPGCGNKPTLLKAGAEKICLTFRLAANVAEQTDLSIQDMIRYRIKVNLLRIADGQFVGSGVGECSSAEEKYQWKKAYGEEYKATPPENRKVKKTKWGDKYVVKVNIYDQANTILKMAKKRALVDAVLTSTGASDLFTQDIEEMNTAQQDDDHDSDVPPKPPITGKDIVDGLDNVTRKITETEATAIRTALEDIDSPPDFPAFCQRLGIARVEDLSASLLPQARKVVVVLRKESKEDK